ncbi:DNA polymerase III polC-type [Hondaea fermentalgiana]|uniref:DNA polymerase III polC-type n=1 Tax=Hondaea fermentalgiana TaxID=2315210 RepID=A0A2R5GNA9_9STRA|nr:DNA polymerase III polC-type [Hondaea fermentalgiana]|eukprot:GBG32376.1 DNA polymerase III polC-type [Hondaea fermentalgiana]
MQDPVIVVFDLETTGFDPMPLLSPMHRILQICAMRLDTGAFFSTIVDPEMRVPPPSRAIHRVGDEETKGAPRLQAAMRALEQELALGDAPCVMVAHNCYFFDELILRKECLRLGAALPSHVAFWDSLPYMRAKFPLIGQWGLSALHEHFFGEPVPNAHRADADVRALARILQHAAPQLSREIAANPRKQPRALTDLRGVGPGRARMITRATGVRFVQDLRAHFGTCPRAFDRFLCEHLRMRARSDRALLVAQVFGIPPWDLEAVEERMGAAPPALCGCAGDHSVLCAGDDVHLRFPGDRSVNAAPVVSENDPPIPVGINGAEEIPFASLVANADVAARVYDVFNLLVHLKLIINGTNQHHLTAPVHSVKNGNAHILRFREVEYVM